MTAFQVVVKLKVLAGENLPVETTDLLRLNQSNVRPKPFKTSVLERLKRFHLIQSAEFVKQTYNQLDFLVEDSLVLWIF